MVNWEGVWAGGLKPGQAFDVGAESPTLKFCLKQCFAPKPGMVALVPGCGRAYDALALAQHGFETVVAIDVAPTAVTQAQKYLGGSRDMDAAKVDCRIADFFELQGEFDFIWDCTFLCALDPIDRERWAAKQRSLLKPGGILASCVFPIGDKVGGPPFALTTELVAGLLEPTGLVCETVAVAKADWHFPEAVASGSTALLLARLDPQHTTA